MERIIQTFLASRASKKKKMTDDFFAICRELDRCKFDQSSIFFPVAAL